MPAPIATTLDMHANLSEKMIDYTPLHFGFKTYPHIDMYEQGIHAAITLIKQLKENVTYYASFEKLPMMPPSINMRTAEGPMHKMIEWAKQAEEEAGIYNVSVFGGFPYSDIPMVGASVLVVYSPLSGAQQCPCSSAGSACSVSPLSHKLSSPSGASST
jgi:microcystin degradation protein MlrC